MAADEELEAEAEEHKAVVSWFELFYDLVVVAAVSLCNDAYLTDPSLSNALTALLSIAALSWVWFITTVFNNMFPNDDLVRRLALLIQMACIVIAALSVNQLDGLSNTVGLIAFACAILIVPLLALRERHGARQARLIKGGLTSVVLAGFICFVGAFLPDRFSGIVVAAALAISVGTAMTAQLDGPAGAALRGDHIRERRGLFILIILGEGFADLVGELHDLGSIPRGAVFALTFVLSFGLWWIYFDGTFSERNSRSIKHWRLALLAHLTLIYGMTGTLDVLVLITVQEEELLGDASLMYFAVSLALVFLSFAVLGMTARGRLGKTGLIQIVSGLFVIALGAVGMIGEDRSVTLVVIACSVLVMANALLAVWADRSGDGGSWRDNWRSVVGRPGRNDGVID